MKGPGSDVDKELTSRDRFYFSEVQGREKDFVSNGGSHFKSPLVYDGGPLIVLFCFDTRKCKSPGKCFNPTLFLSPCQKVPKNRDRNRSVSHIKSMLCYG